MKKLIFGVLTIQYFIIKKFSDNIYAVEPDIAALKKLKDKKIKAFSSIHELPNEVNFDVIRMNWSLEHVHSPDEYFSS